jgi:hypothetical protein
MNLQLKILRDLRASVVSFSQSDAKLFVSATLAITIFICPNLQLVVR